MLTSRGRIDLAGEFADRVYVVEFKCGQSAEAALRQIRERGYAARYAGSGKAVWSWPGSRWTPHQLLGLEVNPRAAAIAELVSWIQQFPAS